MTDKIIYYSFLLLFTLTPLIWTPINFELFEYPKMSLVYLLTIITLAWSLKIITTKKLIVRQTPLNIPLLILLFINLLSSIFSIDRHLSIWGYYSRSNGGLLSLLAYTILYFALTSNLNLKQGINLLKYALISGLLISLYAIPEHFGISPSCVLLTGQLTVNCWVQDVQARVFATLGQPNWLASYLSMLIFPAIYFLITSKTKIQLIAYYLLLITFYLAFTFTYSRGATLGLLAGMVVFIVFLLFRLHPGGVKLNFLLAFKPIIFIILLFLAINLLFGSALTNFKLITYFASPERESIIQAPSTGTQLENGGTESGKVRLIVWKGALEIFKHYPILGTGPETFAYAYYNFRPVEHNLVSEWDFLYNKAHNEYLNYLANTGFLGFLSYLSIIIIFLVISLNSLVLSKIPDTKYQILSASLAASIISYLVTNFFGFSVVITATFFFLFPAIFFLTEDKFTTIQIKAFKNQILKLISIGLTTALLGLLILIVFKNYLADIYFAKGDKLNEAGIFDKAYLDLEISRLLNPIEPQYKIELANAAANLASINPENREVLQSLSKEADELTKTTLTSNPNNVSFLRTAVRTYFILATVEPKFINNALEAIEKAERLAPTDPKILYNKATILAALDQEKEAAKALEKAINLKPNYREARIRLAQVYFKLQKKGDALEQLRIVLDLIPNDPEASKLIKEFK